MAKETINLYFSADQNRAVIESPSRAIEAAKGITPTSNDDEISKLSLSVIHKKSATIVVLKKIPATPIRR